VKFECIGGGGITKKHPQNTLFGCIGGGLLPCFLIIEGGLFPKIFFQKTSIGVVITNEIGIFCVFYAEKFNFRLYYSFSRRNIIGKMSFFEG